MAIVETISKTITCKNCGSTACVKFGKYKGIQRYYCKVCKRKFKADSDAFHMKVPAEYVSQAVAEFYAGRSVNDIRETLFQEHKYKPSKSLVWKWVTKYTDLAVKHFKDYHPNVGSVWTRDEAIVYLDKKLTVWVYDVIDEKTRYMLASRIALFCTMHDSEMVVKEAQKRAGKTPTQVLADYNCSYDDGEEIFFGAETEHVKTKPFTLAANTQPVERYHGTYKERIKVMRAFKDMETLTQYNKGWLVFYNYFKPHQALEGKTPAEEAGIKYDVNNWADLMRVPVPKDAEVKSHIKPKQIIPKTKKG